MVNAAKAIGIISCVLVMQGCVYTNTVVRREYDYPYYQYEYRPLYHHRDSFKYDHHDHGHHNHHGHHKHHHD